MEPFKYTETELDNGLATFIYPIPHFKHCSIVALIKAGTKHETDRTNGLAHLLEHLNFKSSRDFPEGSQIAKTLDKVGCSFNAYTVKNMTVFHFGCHPKFMNIVLHVISQMLFYSLHSPIDIKSERKVVHEEIEQTDNSYDEVIDDYLCEIMYPNSILSLPTLGTKKSLANIDRNDIVEFYEKYYVPNNIKLVIVGNLPTSPLPAIKKYFGNIVAKPILPLNITYDTENNKPVTKIISKNTSHCYINIAFPAYNLTNPKGYPLSLLTLHLGGYMSSLLYIALREVNSLVYEISADVVHYEDGSYLSIYTSTNCRNGQLAINIIIDVLQKLKKTKINAKQLQVLKVNKTHTKELDWEDSYNIAEYYAEQMAFFPEIRPMDEHIKAYNKVSLPQINKVIDEVIDFNRMKIVVIGKVKGITLKL